jgi:carboxylesterase type B
MTNDYSLYIDVWVPPNANSSSGLPVKVWIYGGGEQGGGIQNPLYDGCNLAAHGTLVVSIAYRVGPIGFLTLASAGIAGNFGVQDLLLGLEWVQAHIASFGGNPVSFLMLLPGRSETMLTIPQQKKVLLFGQSAGAANTFLLSTLPKATSLFNAAIWESGYGPQLATPAVANSLGSTYATRLNCSTTDVSTHLLFLVSRGPSLLTTNLQAACLRSVSTSVLQATAPEGLPVTIYSGLNPVDFQPYVDGVTIPSQPWSVGPKVPMIFGTNSDEGGLFTLATYRSPLLSAANYSAFLAENFGPAASLVAKQYPLTLPAFNQTGFPAFAAINTVLTQAQFTCPAYQAMLTAQSNNIPVYTYLSSHVPACAWSPVLPAAAIPFVGATHSSELPLVFGNGVNQPLPSGNCSFTTQEKAISETLIAAWSAMASTGNPSVQGGLQWPQWNSTSSIGVNIVNATSVGAVDYSQCAFWDMINNMYLNFTVLGSSANGTSGNSSTSSGKGNGSTGTGTKNGAERGADLGAWGLSLAMGIGVAALIG